MTHPLPCPSQPASQRLGDLGYLGTMPRTWHSPSRDLLSLGTAGLGSSSRCPLGFCEAKREDEGEMAKGLSQKHLCQQACTCLTAQGPRPATGNSPAPFPSSSFGRWKIWAQGSQCLISDHTASCTFKGTQTPCPPRGSGEVTGSAVSMTLRWMGWWSTVSSEL